MKQSEAIEAVAVWTVRYERTYGEKPSGYGQWVFYIGLCRSVLFKTDTPMPYDEAVALAKSEAVRLGWDDVYVVALHKANR